MAKITANPAAGTLTLELNGVEQTYKPAPGVDLMELYRTLEQMGEYFPTNLIAYLRANAALEGAEDDPVAAALDPKEDPTTASPDAAAPYVPAEGEEPPPGATESAGVSDQGIAAPSDGSATIDGVPLAPDMPQEGPWPDQIQGDERPVYNGWEASYMEDYATWQKSFPAGVVYTKVDGGAETALVDSKVVGVWDPAINSGTVFGLEEVTSGELPLTPATASDPAVPGETEQQWQRDMAAKTYPHAPVAAKPKSTKENAMTSFVVREKVSRQKVAGPFASLDEAHSAHIFEHGFSELLEASSEDDVAKQDWDQQVDPDAATVAKTQVGDTDVYTATDADGKPISTYVDGGDGKGREVGKTEASDVIAVLTPSMVAADALIKTLKVSHGVGSKNLDSGVVKLLFGADEPDLAARLAELGYTTTTNGYGNEVWTKDGLKESGEWENLRSVAGGGGRKPIKNAWKTIKVNDRVMFKTDTQTRTGIVTYKDEQPDGAVTVDVGGQSLEVPSMDITAVWRKSTKESAPRRFMLTKRLTESRVLNEGAPKRHRNLVQYSDGGNQLATSRITRPALEAGMYEIKSSMSGIYFEKVDINSDELLKFEDERLNLIHEEINGFWGLAEAFKEMGITHKRGVLLTGVPGMGKSCLMKQVIEAAIEQDTVVFVGSRDMGTVVAGLREFKEVEPERRALVTMEDMDEVCQYNEHAVLEMMDGGDQMNGVLVMGTTNYPERLPPRILRSGRFDTKMEVKALPMAGRQAYFTHKLAKKETAARIAEIAEATDGMSFAQMRELIASVYCYGRPFESSVQRILKNLIEGTKTGHRWTEKQLDRLLEQTARTGVKPAGLRMLNESKVVEAADTSETAGVTTICGKELWKSQVLATAADATFEEENGTIWAWQDGRCIGSYVTELNSGILESKEVAAGQAPFKEAEVQPDPTVGAGADLGSAIDLKTATDDQLQGAFFGKTVAQILSDLAGEYAVDDLLALATRADFETLEPVTRAVIMTAFDFFSTQTEGMQESEAGVALGELAGGDSGATGDHAELRHTQDAGKNGDWKITIYRGWTRAEEWEYFADKAAALQWAAEKGISWSKADLQRLGEARMSREQLDEMWDKYERLDRACNEEFGDQAPATRRAQVTKSFNEFSKACQFMGLNPAKEVRERTRASMVPDTVVTEAITEATVKKGAFHKWLGKSPDAKITPADVAKGLRSDDAHVRKMAQFAKNMTESGSKPRPNVRPSPLLSKLLGREARRTAPTGSSAA